MHPTFDPCLIVSDYPLKAMIYKKLLGQLNVSHTELIDWIPDMDENIYPMSPLVIVDLNVPSEEEKDCLNLVRKAFRSAQIVFLEESHSGARLYHEDDRDIACIGKLLELEETRLLISNLISAATPTPPKVAINH